MSLRTSFLAGVLVAVLTGCGHGSDAPALPRAEGLKTLTAGASGAAAGGLPWDGVVEAVRSATLSAQTAGRVTEVQVDVGDRVRAGQVLLRLTSVEQRAGSDAARAQLMSADASLIDAEANYRRVSALLDRQYVSRATVDQARAQRDAARAARDAARAQLANADQQTDYTVVRAPYDGIVGARLVEPGESLAAGQALVSVYAPGGMRVQVQVPQDQAETLRASPQASVLLDDGRRVEPEQVIVYPQADAATHSVTVRLPLPASGPALMPGTTVKVVFPAIGGEAALPVVPASAVLQRGEVSAVYVLRDGRPELRQIRIGERSGGMVRVISGLKTGETVAADPVAALEWMGAVREGEKVRE